MSLLHRLSAVIKLKREKYTFVFEDGSTRENWNIGYTYHPISDNLGKWTCPSYVEPGASTITCGSKRCYGIPIQIGNNFSCSLKTRFKKL